jgi:phospholipid/cholesterol/gamma-HCH transport system substrate-binding protein
METRARYVVVGLFTLAVLAVGFVFVSWIGASGVSGRQTDYEIRYEGSVAGLRPGSAVVFNGVRVGQVTRVRVDPAAPGQVLAAISVEANTPVRSDTRAGIEYQGLTGSPSVSLSGGQASAAPPAERPGGAATLVADPALSRGLTESARDVLGKVGTVVDQNAEPLRETIANLSTFSAALARNSGRLDSIVAGVERMTGGGSANAPLPSFDLSAPTSFPPRDRIPEMQLAVAEPTALLAFDTRRILAAGPKGDINLMEGGQWTDNIPKLVLAKIVQGFEKAGYPRAGQGPDALDAELQLQLDIRRFQVKLEPDATAEIEFGAKVVTKQGELRQARTFQSSVPLAGADAVAATEGLNKAFGAVATEVVVWSLEQLP